MCVYTIVGLADYWGGIVKELCLGMRMFMILGLFILLCINDLPHVQPGMKATLLACLTFLLVVLWSRAPK